MKTSTIFLFVITFLLSVTSSAQHLGNSVMAEIGDVVSIVTADSNAIVEGPSGHGLVWDFSELAPIGDPGITTYVNPADTPDHAQRNNQQCNQSTSYRVKD